MTYHFRFLFLFLFVNIFCSSAQEDSLVIDSIDYEILADTIDFDTLWMTSWKAEWDDVLYEWVIHYETLNDEGTGEVEATWSHIKDWTQWDFSIGDYDGTIWQKWDQRDDLWELKCNGVVTKIRTEYYNDYSSWIIEYNQEIKVKWRSESYNDGNFWVMLDKKYGELQFYTEFEDDPRDWLIFDNTIDQLPFDVKLACYFTAMYRATSGYR